MICAVFAISPLYPPQAALDTQVRELNTRLEEGLANATKIAKRDAAKLQARVSPKYTFCVT